MTTDKLKMTVHEKEISIRYSILAFIFWVLTLSWIVTIYSMSAQTGAQSSQLSHGFVSALNERFNLNIQDDSIIRLMAHAGEFALLTFLSYMALSSTNKISNKTSYAESPVKLMRSDNEINIVFTLWF